MKKHLHNRYSWVVCTLLITLSLASCYKFSRIAAPKTVAPNTAYEGRIVAVNDGNNGEQTGYSVFAIRVPRNWEVNVGDNAYQQYGPAGVKNENGEDINMTARMVYSVTLSDLYNTSNPKEGYEWIAFRTEHVNRRSLVQGTGCDSIVFNYTVMNDGVAGSYELDYILGSIEQNEDDVNAIDKYATDLNGFLGSDLCRVSTEHASNQGGGTNDFSNVMPEFKTTITVKEGGNPVVNDPAIILPSATVEPESTVTINYTNLPQGAMVKLYKQASILAMNQVGQVEGSGRHNNGSFTVTGLEPGIYHVKALRGNGTELDGCKEALLTVKDYTDKALPYSQKLMVIGEPCMLAPSQLKATGKAYDTALGLNAALCADAPEIMGALIDSALAYKPEALLIAGGLTMDGGKESHEYLASMLKRLTDAGIKVCVVPGDQDINNPTSSCYNGDEATRVANINASDFANIYAPFGYADAVMRDENSLSYLSYIDYNVAVLALDACEYEYADTVTDVIKTAHLSPATVEWMQKAASTALSSGHYALFILVHHLVGAPFVGYATLGNILNNNDKIDLVSSILGTSEGEAAPAYELCTADIQDAMRDCLITAAFTGDANALDIALMDNAFYQVNTSSAIAYDCPFRLVGIGENKFELETRYATNLPGRDGLSFENYAYYRTKYGWDAYINTLCVENWDAINGFLQENFVFDYDPEVDAFDTNMFFHLPSTPEQMATLLMSSIIPPLIETIVTFADGNEHLKESQQLVDDFLAGIDNLLSGLNDLPAIINPMLKEGFAAAGLDLDAMATAVVSSIAYNYAEDPGFVVNDLFLSSTFTTRQGIDNIKANNANTIYDLQGRRIEQPTKGLYIMGNQKVLIK